MTNRKNGWNTGRDADGKFGVGNPGKPMGARHRATLAAQTLLDGEAEALSRKAIDLALEGDTTALRLCLERIAPPRKDAPVTFSLPEMQAASDAFTAVNQIVQAVAKGEITPGEATSLASLVETFRKTAETDDLAKRIERLEQRK